MLNREELRQKGRIGRVKTRCLERGKISFSERGGTSIGFRLKYRPLRHWREED
jgi:hypothetical protein